MPVRDGRWVSNAVIFAERKAAEQAAAQVADNAPAPAGAEPQAKVTRRSRKAAAAAIKDATGVTVDMETPA